MILEFVKSLLIIIAAEMGDKTQILALTFATQFKVGQVLMGVGLGSFLNHGLAVLLGTYLSAIIPMNRIQIIAGFLFVAFALWSLKLEEEESETVKKSKGPLMTVALAFFIGELGDKTQLTAITLSADAVYPWAVLIGTVTGMIVVSYIGIFVGSKIGQRIPELGIKLLSFVVFMGFGLQKLVVTLPKGYLRPFPIGMFVLIVGGLAIYLLRPILSAIKEGRTTALQEAALTLYAYKQQTRRALDQLCLGEETCGQCDGVKCAIGYSKDLLDRSMEDENYSVDKSNVGGDWLDKAFNRQEVIKQLVDVVTYLDKVLESEQDQVIHEIRHSLEEILFHQALDWTNLETYVHQLEEVNQEVAEDFKSYI